jgi:hypothetical protein
MNYIFYLIYQSVIYQTVLFFYIYNIYIYIIYKVLFYPHTNEVKIETEILHTALYGYKILSLTLREEHMGIKGV